jgi:UDP-GlcNAc:undecaprenyl-phosphate GlcNAc-1-phosphate transferase
MAEIMYRQIKCGRSPFRPDRHHLHHICQRAGLSKVQTLMVICGLSSTFAGIGIVGEYYQIPESLMFVGFLGCFVTYSVLLLRNWPSIVVLKVDAHHSDLIEITYITSANEQD